MRRPSQYNYERIIMRCHNDAEDCRNPVCSVEFDRREKAFSITAESIVPRR